MDPDKTDADIDPDNFAGVTSNVDPNSSNANMDLDNFLCGYRSG